MRIIFRKKKLLVLVISFALVAFFALSWITNHRTALLSQKNELPAPYNNFNYLYIVSRFSKNSFSRIAYVNQSVQTQAVFQTTPTSASINFGYGIFSDGKGFYEAKEQMEQPIPCGNQQLSATSKLDWIHQQCISVNGKNYIVAGSGTYYDGNPYYVNSTYVIYEQCVKTSFYQGRNKNDCSKYALKVNDTVIDTSDEGYEHYDNTISSAPEFKDVKVNGNILTYIKSYSSPDTIQDRTEFISYNLSSNTKKVQYSSPDNSSILGGQLIDGKPVILLASNAGYGISLGELNGMTNTDRENYFNNYWNTETPTYSLRFADGRQVDNVRAFASNNGHLYFLQKSTIATTLNNLPSVLLLKDNLAAVEFNPSDFGMSNIKFYIGSIEIYPNCKSSFTVCLYNNGDYLVQNEIKKDNTTTPSAYDWSNGASVDGSKHMPSSWLMKPTTYYPNGIQMQNAFDGNNDSPFVFSSNGDTYLVYYHFNTIYGQNVSKGDQPVKLFELNPPVNWDSSDTIYQLRVFPK